MITHVVPKGSAASSIGYSLKQLAESIILQALEDLWSPLRGKESVRFFKGKGFELCSAMAEMTEEQRVALLTMVAAAAAKSHTVAAVPVR